MTRLPKLRLYSILRWGSSNFPSNLVRLQEYPISGTNFPFLCSYNNVDILYKYFSTMANDIDEKVYVNNSSVSKNGEIVQNISAKTRKEVQGALLDYFHCTRNLPFTDAENLSKNSPKFVNKLMKNINRKSDIQRSVTRFLCYNPINEFEPFFESIGLDSSKFVPRDSLYLSDEDGLLDNYHVLYEYGIAPNGLGNIYRIAREVFQYGDGVLISKLRVFEEMGCSSFVIAKAVSFNPYLLIDDKGYEFFKLASKLQCLGCGYDWIEEHLLSAYYNWRQIFELLVMLNEMGCKGTDLEQLLRERPQLLFDCSGQSAYSLVGFLLKFGSTKNDICSMFLHFPKVNVRKFVENLRRGFKLHTESQRNGVYTGRVFRTHFMMLGSTSLRKVRPILASLDGGGARCREQLHSRREKIKFLSSIGFANNSKKIERALKIFRGKGNELKERFDCLVKAGLSEEDVVAMVKEAPHILNQSKEVLETKIGHLVNDLGYPVSSLKPFPYCLSYSMERVKLRCLMCNWLVSKNVTPKLTLYRQIKPTESSFVKKLVNKHPQGPDVWQELKNNYAAGVDVKHMLASLDIGGTRCCEHIVANPLEPKNRVLKTKAERLPEPKKRVLRTKAEQLPEPKKRVLRTKAERLPEPKKRVLRRKAERLPEPKKQVLRTKAERLPESSVVNSRTEKIKFLSSIGFAENSKDMERALNIFRGKGGELQNRFDCLVKAGLSEEDVVAIVKGAPHTLSLSKEGVEAKIKYLVNDLGYPLSSLKTFPYFLSYSMKRVKLRCSMCKWLVDKGVVNSTVALCTRIASKESDFVKNFVDKHPQGLEVWQELKNKYSA